MHLLFQHEEDSGPDPPTVSHAEWPAECVFNKSWVVSAAPERESHTARARDIAELTNWQRVPDIAVVLKIWSGEGRPPKVWVTSTWKQI